MHFCLFQQTCVSSTSAYFFFQIYVCYCCLQGIQGEPGESGLIGPPGATVCLSFIDDTVEPRLSGLIGT